MTEARKPLNDRLRFITVRGHFDRSAIAKAIVARAAFISNPDRYSGSIWESELAGFSTADWLRVADEETWAEAKGEMALYEARKARIAPEITMIAAE